MHWFFYRQWKIFVLFTFLYLLSSFCHFNTHISISKFDRKLFNFCFQWLVFLFFHGFRYLLHFLTRMILSRWFTKLLNVSHIFSDAFNPFFHKLFFKMRWIKPNFIFNKFIHDIFCHFTGFWFPLVKLLNIHPWVADICQEYKLFSLFSSIRCFL